ncbi:MAG: CYTH domain-containing protein [Paludibacteraceae bacterium]|nr:CYTH domain-containing protein [Paludibacteraceae bacterium]
MNHNNLEIERKFLVRDESYKSLATESHLLRQGYISKMPGRTVRVRIRDDKAYLTIKVRMTETSFTRHEWEYEIPVADAEQMLAVCLPGLIEKRRWIIPATSPEGKAICWEVDEFLGRLAGLTLAEIELENETQVFDKPDFVTEEVTGDPRYYNANM